MSIFHFTHEWAERTNGRQEAPTLRRRTARMVVARGDAGFAVRGYAIMKRGYLFIALATLFFSTMEIALKEVAGLFNPVQLNLTRFLIGGLVLIPFARRMLRKRGVRIDGLSLVKLAGLGFLGIVVSMTLYQLAVENTNASVVAVLFSCNPVFVLVFAGLILRTQILRQHVMALVLECLGILILINPLDTSISTAGITFTLLSTAVFALYAVLGTKMCAKYSGVVVTCGSFLFASLEMAAIVAVRAGFACYFMAMEATSPITASLVFFFKPALAPVLALVFLQEAIPVSMVVGVLFILAGSLVSLIPALSMIPAMALGKVWCWKQGRA